MVDKLSIKGSWDELKGHIKQQFADVTDDELLRFEGKIDELVGHLETKTGESREQIMSKLNNYLN